MAGFFSTLLHSKFGSKTGAGLLGVGGYVLFQDHKRYLRIEESFKNGRIREPREEVKADIYYYKRPQLEKQLENMLGPNCSGQYYVVKGDVGTGKSRVLVEVVKKMIKENKMNPNKTCAPIYMSAAHCKDFAESLANVVQFYFDEHLSINFLIRLVTGIESKPRANDQVKKLCRVLDAIEDAALRYKSDTGCTAVLIIDGVEQLLNSPHILDHLQQKAKLWADTNIVKVILITNDEGTSTFLRRNKSAWSRIGNPVNVNDLDREQAKELLQSQEHQNLHGCKTMRDEDVETAIQLVGGRIYDLMLFKQDWENGVNIEETVQRMSFKEKEKFTNISKSAQETDIIRLLSEADNCRIALTKLKAKAEAEHIHKLVAEGILSLERTHGDLYVRFESMLTENVAKAVVKAWRDGS